MSRPEPDLLYHSYFSISLKDNSNELSGDDDEFENILLGSNYPTDSIRTTNFNHSPDLVFDNTLGRITANATGTYLFVYQLVFESTQITNISLFVRKNGSDEFYTAGTRAFAQLEHCTTTCHGLIDLVAGDYLEVGASTDNEQEFIVNTGTNFTLLKANGDYGNVKYTENASAGAINTLEVIGDTQAAAGGGTVVTNLKNVSISNGLMTPSNTRPFLAFATLVGEHSATSGETELGIYANGSAIDDTSVLIHSNSDPDAQSFALLKNLTGGQTASGRYKASSTKTIATKNGSSFTIFDVSNNSGNSNPSAFLSFSIDGDSSALNGNDATLFKDDVYSSYSTVTHATATGITYSSNTGTFVPASSGKYFVVINLIIGDLGANRDFGLDIQKNGTDIYVSTLHLRSQFDPQEKTLCLILDADAGDSFTFILGNDGSDSSVEIKSGTTISMFKVDDLKELHAESVPTDSLIADDFTINSFSAAGLSPQYNRLETEQVPFSLGIRGPMSLRGRPTNTDGTPSNISTGTKKT